MELQAFSTARATFWVRRDTRARAAKPFYRVRLDPSRPGDTRARGETGPDGGNIAANRGRYARARRNPY
jgi:hypothetical protein